MWHPPDQRYKKPVPGEHIQLRILHLELGLLPLERSHKVKYQINLLALKMEDFDTQGMNYRKKNEARIVALIEECSSRSLPEYLSADCSHD